MPFSLRQRVGKFGKDHCGFLLIRLWMSVIMFMIGKIISTAKTVSAAINITPVSCISVWKMDSPPPSPTPTNGASQNKKNFCGTIKTVMSIRIESPTWRSLIFPFSSDSRLRHKTTKRISFAMLIQISMIFLPIQLTLDGKTDDWITRGESCISFPASNVPDIYILFLLLLVKYRLDFFGFFTILSLWIENKNTFTSSVSVE